MLIGVINSSVSSSRIGNGIMSVSFSTNMALKRMNRIGIILNIAGFNYTT